MLDPEIFWLKFEALGVNFATGVPDSLLKDFCYFLEDNLPKKRHIIAANEGGSIAIATGHYISSEKPALVYMQAIIEEPQAILSFLIIRSTSLSN